MQTGQFIEAELEKVTHKKEEVQASRRTARLNEILGIKSKKRFKEPGT